MKERTIEPEQSLYNYYTYGEREEPDTRLQDQVRQREVMAYINSVNSVIRRTPLDWKESEAQHALKSILTCVVGTYHLKVTEGGLMNMWIDAVDEAIDSLVDDEGLSQ
jgi:hypothetical protein